MCLELDERRAQLRHTLATLTEGESYLYLGGLRDQRDTVLSAAIAVGDHDVGYAFVLAAKGRVARLTLQTRAQIRNQLPSEARSVVERLVRL